MFKAGKHFNRTQTGRCLTCDRFQAESHRSAPKQEGSMETGAEQSYFLCARHVLGTLPGWPTSFSQSPSETGVINSVSLMAAQKGDVTHPWSHSH